MTSPFTSPPPPYSPQHPHVMLDHEKVPTVVSDPPPPLPPSCELGPGQSPGPRGLRGADGDIFHLAPSAALTLMARNIELLVRVTGDLPTPPASSPATPSDSYSTASSSDGGDGGGSGACLEPASPDAGYYFGSPSAPDHIDGIKIRSPLTPPPAPGDRTGCVGGHGGVRVWAGGAGGVCGGGGGGCCGGGFDSGTSIIHHGGVDDRTHYGTIARKFWSKSAPETPIEEYLFRYE